MIRQLHEWNCHALFWENPGVMARCNDVEGVSANGKNLEFVPGKQEYESARESGHLDPSSHLLWIKPGAGVNDEITIRMETK